MTLTRISTLALVRLLVAPAALAEEAKPGDTITWSKDLPSALAKAKKEQKVVMVCINAKMTLCAASTLR